ncbi:SusC/RagA family TonB-linked outer membrane protein [Snuella sedimenti]|uniref:SusC/RagA family TonB-linked outer membrane protein n=1 Tax=Snuella sedimenti TaxID=2798802 RepID=A0A8J7JDC4_9FLAO|nr:SusC/RagA family TonB-linked outer membrane protein [Snuella sedimenti]MBJ6368944.1 SusC/RagA family TonB-linked outer membrane protein [Snuella sedimenti]
MRTFIFLCCVTVFSLTPNNIVSQNSKIIVEESKLLTVDEVFDLIMQQTDYRFFYEEGIFKGFPKIKVKKGVISTNKLLKQSLSQGDLSIKVTEKNAIIIEEKAPEQQKYNISGTVVDQSGQPLLGANIIEKGTTNGAQTDFDGSFSMTVSNKEAILVVSYIGFVTKEISINNETTLTITLEEDAAELAEVVVTALGIRKEKKRVGFAIQEVEGESLQKAVTPNVLESMTGKVAGLIVTSSSGEFYSDPQMYIRGHRPLLVIDGVPQTRTDSWNFSSDDVESITVLKGTSAAALYGSAGRNGAVQITLKSGRGANGTEFSFNSSTMFQNGFLRVPTPQYQYGPGSNGIYEYGTGAAGSNGLNDFDYSIWGPKFDGRLIKQFDSPIDPVTGERIPTPWVSRGKDNLKNFMEVGLVTSNNITIRNSSEKGSYIISNSYKYAKASTPGQRLDINTLRLNGNLILSDAIDVDASLQYNYQFADNRLRGAYGPTSPVYTLAIWGAANFDIRNFKNYWEPGKEGIRQYFVEHWRYNNPYALAHAWKKPWTKNDVLAYLKVNFKLGENLKGYVRSTVNSYSLTDNEEISKDIYDYSIPDRQGRFRYNASRNFENNTDFLLMFNKEVNKDFTIDATLGANQRYLRYESEYASTTQLVVPEVFTLENSKDKVTPSSYKEYKGIYSAYGSVDFSIKNYLFVGATGRFDKSSTMPEANDTYFYPSIYSSVIVSDLFDLPKPISYLKLRTSYAKVGSTLGVYEGIDSYGTGNWRDLPTAGYPSVIRNPDLRPAATTSYEHGVDLRLFKGRLGVDFTYYENVDGPGIFTQPFSSASGYSGTQFNGRVTETRGMEITVTAVPFQSNDFKWETMINFSKYKEYLTSLPPAEDGTPRLNEGKTFLGDRLFNYWWYDWDRSPDGQLIIGDNGLPKQTDFTVNLGNTQPDFEGSITNTITYKNVSLNVLIDGRFGGITYDRYERDMWRSGTHPDAIHPERELSNVAYATGGDPKTMLIEGVSVASGDVTYDPEGNILEDTRVFEPNTTKIDYQTWAQRYKAAWENHVIEKTFAKLREVTLTYNFSSKILDKTFFKRASISLIGRNLFYWTKDKDTFGDLDTYTVSTGDTNLQMPTQRSYGLNINLQF